MSAIIIIAALISVGGVSCIHMKKFMGLIIGSVSGLFFSIVRRAIKLKSNLTMLVRMWVISCLYNCLNSCCDKSSLGSREVNFAKFLISDVQGTLVFAYNVLIK